MLCGGYRFKITKRLPGSILLFIVVLICASAHLCVSLCVESRKGVILYTKAITYLATPPGTRVYDLWCMRYLYVMCVHVSPNSNNATYGY